MPANPNLPSWGRTGKGPLRDFGTGKYYAPGKLYSPGPGVIGIVDNAHEGLFFTFGVEAAALSRLRDEQGRWTRAAYKMATWTHMQLALMATLMRRAIEEEFARHNKTGKSIKTLSIRIHGLSCLIIMGGGMIFVQYGSGPHAITARNSSVLAFQDTSGQTVFTQYVWHPGYRGDPFLDRARRRVNLDRMLRSFASYVFSEMEGVKQARTDTDLYTTGEFYSGRAMGMGI